MNTENTLEVAPAKIAEGQWVVRSAHLIGSDQVCPDELSAKRMAKFAEACIKAARAKDQELIQMLVDALDRIGVESDVVNWHDCPDGHAAGEFSFADARSIVSALAAAAAQGFKPSDQ